MGLHKSEKLRISFSNIPNSWLAIYELDLVASNNSVRIKFIQEIYRCILQKLNWVQVKSINFQFVLVISEFHLPVCMKNKFTKLTAVFQNEWCHRYRISINVVPEIFGDTYQSTCPILFHRKPYRTDLIS